MANFPPPLQVTSSVVFSQSIPLSTSTASYMPQVQANSAFTFTPSSTKVLKATSYLRVVADGVNVPTFPGFVEWGNSLGYLNTAGIVNQITFWYDGTDSFFSVSQGKGVAAIALKAYSITLSGSTSGVAGTAYTYSTSILPLTGTFIGTVTITPSDGGAGGTFFPATFNATSGSSSSTFTYTPSAAATVVISISNNSSVATNGAVLVNPSNISLAVSAAPPIATAISLSGPSSGTVSVASSNFTVSVTPIGGTISGTVIVTPSDGSSGGAFSPTTASLTTASPTASFTYTPSSTAGAKTITITNNSSLANPSAITYTATAATGIAAGNSSFNPQRNSGNAIFA